MALVHSALSPQLIAAWRAIFQISVRSGGSKAYFGELLLLWRHFEHFHILEVDEHTQEVARHTQQVAHYNVCSEIVRSERLKEK